MLSFLLSFTHLFCTTDFLSGKNTITLKNGKPSTHDFGGKKGETKKKGKTMASSVALKNRESKSNKRIVNRKHFGWCRA